MNVKELIRDNVEVSDGYVYVSWVEAKQELNGKSFVITKAAESKIQQYDTKLFDVELMTGEGKHICTAMGGVAISKVLAAFVASGERELTCENGLQEVQSKETNNKYWIFAS